MECILNIDDEEFLSEINSALENRISEPNIIELEPWRRKRIEESLKQIESGEVHLHEDVMKEMEEWLKKSN
jgi:predicted transcriptional regulator